MRKLLALGVLVLVLLAVDLGARVFAEGKLASRAREAGLGADAADATITSFPFLGRLAASGSVPHVAVRAVGVNAGLVRVAAVEVEAWGVALDRASLLSGDVRLDEIDRGVVTVELDASAITDVVDIPVRVTDGQVRVGGDRVGITATLTVDPSGALVLRVAGLRTLTVPLVRTALIPCVASEVSVRDDRVRLSCEVDELPGALRR